MTPTEKGRRVDALNQGPDTRRVLCEMVANREADLEDARAENAKLRELVRDMCVWAYIDSDCDLEDRFADRMDELRIETD